MMGSWFGMTLKSAKTAGEARRVLAANFGIMDSMDLFYPKIWLTKLTQSSIVTKLAVFENFADALVRKNSQK